MRRPIFIGDEVTAAGFRLAGFEAWPVAEGAEPEQLRRAAEAADLVLVTAGFARAVPDSVLRRYQVALRPLLVIVEDALGAHPLPDVAQRLRRQVGVGE